MPSSEFALFERGLEEGSAEFDDDDDDLKFGNVYLRACLWLAMSAKLFVRLPTCFPPALELRGSLGGLFGPSAQKSTTLAREYTRASLLKYRPTFLGSRRLRASHLTKN